MIVAIIFIALLAAAAIALVTFLGATAVGTVVGIVAAIHQGRAARRAAAAAGVPYRRITYKQAREERLARQAAEGGAPRHMAPRPGPLRTDAAGRRQAAAAAEAARPGYWTSAPAQPCDTGTPDAPCKGCPDCKGIL